MFKQITPGVDYSVRGLCRKPISRPVIREMMRAAGIYVRRALLTKAREI